MNSTLKSCFVLCALLLCTSLCFGKEVTKNHYDPIVEKLGKPTWLIKKSPTRAELHYRLYNGDNIIMTVDSGFLTDSRHEINIPRLIKSINRVEIEHTDLCNDSSVHYWDVIFTDNDIDTFRSFLKIARPWKPKSIFGRKQRRWIGSLTADNRTFSLHVGTGLDPDVNSVISLTAPHGKKLQYIMNKKNSHKFTEFFLRVIDEQTSGRKPDRIEKRD